ncbi:MAG: carboxypeptidase regulatory-like domain-containing protein [Blastocatellia bacterium]
MSHFANRLLFPLICLIASTSFTLAQVPTGGVRGTVTDPSNAVVTNAMLTVTNRATGAARQITTGATGQYQIENLQPGEYEVKASVPGFKTALTAVTIQVGDNATVDFALEVGGANEMVSITSDTPTINTTDYKVAGVVNRQQIENLPLNGRNFLQLALLEPGVGVNSVANTGALPNNFFRVSIAGAGQQLTRISVDGVTINDKVTGGTAQNFSQEMVQEFQISTFNFDISTSVTGAGSVNVVSRSGTNDLHGSAFFYFRDHNLSAYPDLGRDPRRIVDPSRNDPFFARRQSGGSLGGPIRKDKLFWFFNLEHNNQDSVFPINNNHPIFSQFDTVYPNPLAGTQANLRLDWKLSEKHSTFLRLSNDLNDLFTPQAAAGATMPSAWFKIKNVAGQGVLGVTSILTPKLVNDFRLNYQVYSNHIDRPTTEDCSAAAICLGLGGPQIRTQPGATAFVVGNHNNVTQNRLPRIWQLVETLNWQKGAHRMRVGGEWEHLYFVGHWAFAEPAIITLWAPELVQAASPTLYAALPASLKAPGKLPTLDEILQLPLRVFSTGIGNAGQPAAFNYEDDARNNRFRVYFGAAWQVRQNFTFTYGLAYAYEDNLLNHNLDRPAILSKFTGGDLNPPKRDRNNFDPSFGFAWNAGGKGRTVIRGGAGIYHDSNLAYTKLQEQGLVGPAGSGRVSVDGSFVQNPLNPAQTLNFASAPTTFRGADLARFLPQIRTDLSARFGAGSDLSVRGVEVVKQANQIFDPDTVIGYSANVSVGVQRELARNLAVQADFVMRRSVHFGFLNAFDGLFDRNRFNRAASLGGVVLPACTAAQRIDPKAVCSTGAFNFAQSNENYRYTGLLVKVDKRFSADYQFTASYALSKFTGFNTVINFDNYNEADGYQAADRTHRLTFSGTMQAPRYQGQSRFLRALANTWRVSLIAQFASKLPLNPLIGAIDLDGDGNASSLLPGAPWNSLGRQLSQSDLQKLVSDFNANFAGKRTPRNQLIPTITLPAEFDNGDIFITQDLRVMREIRVRDKYRLQLIGEAFNLFNIANLGGYSGVLNGANFGQPSSRVGQVFGSGGPRAFQLAARISF